MSKVEKTKPEATIFDKLASLESEAKMLLDQAAEKVQLAQLEYEKAQEIYARVTGQKIRKTRQSSGTRAAKLTDEKIASIKMDIPRIAGPITRSKVAERFQISGMQATQILMSMADEKLLKPMGSGRSRTYDVAD
jgi:ribosomal protein S25